MIVDFHIHTNCSDGGIDPRQLLEKLKEEGVELASITDHDNIVAYEIIKNEDKKGIKFIQGIEIDVGFESRVLHILLYGFDKDSIAMRDYLRRVRKHDIAEFERMVKETSALYNLSINDKAMKDFEKRNCYFDKVRLNNFLTEQGFAQSPKEAFIEFTRQVKDKTRYVLLSDEFFKLAKESGGVSILAHPMKYDEDITKVEDIIIKLAKEGLDGVEVRNNRQTKEEERELLLFARKQGLLICGGSDFHCKIGATEKKRLGCALEKRLTDKDISKEILNLKTFD